MNGRYTNRGLTNRVARSLHPRMFLSFPNVAYPTKCRGGADLVSIETLLEDDLDVNDVAPVAQPGRWCLPTVSVALVRAPDSGSPVEAKVAGSKPARGSTFRVHGLRIVLQSDLFRIVSDFDNCH